jgi:hypothetical protein
MYRRLEDACRRFLVVEIVIVILLPQATFDLWHAARGEQGFDKFVVSKKRLPAEVDPDDLDHQTLLFVAYPRSVQYKRELRAVFAETQLLSNRVWRLFNMPPSANA